MLLLIGVLSPRLFMQNKETMKKQFIDAEYTDEEFYHNGELYAITLTGLYFWYSPPIRGHRNSMGVPEEPDDPAEVEYIGAENVTVDRYLEESGKTEQVVDTEEIIKEFEKRNSDKINEFIYDQI
jgi:hypothetical protein